jgi:hypothetical protein
VTRLTSKNEHKEEKKEKEEIRRHPLRSLVYPFEVIVSPFKAFKEIAQNPELKGFFLIVILFIVTSVGVQYAYASKILLSISDKQPISPTLHVTQGTYVYVTTFGNYTFKPSQPNSINYTFIYNTPLAEYSAFLVNTTETLTLVNPLLSSNISSTFYQITADLNQSTIKVGNFTLMAEFFQNERPKFSVIVNKTAEWNLGDFVINWFIRSPYSFTFLANRTTTLNLASTAGLSLLETNVTSAELGSTSSINDWRFSILSDWSDYGNATIYGGNLTFLTYPGTWLKVVFGANDPKIDFTTVSLTYSAFFNTYAFGGYLLSYETLEATAFFLQWLIYAGALLLIAKLFGEERKKEESDEEGKEVIKEKISLRSFFTIVGYVFSVRIIGLAVNAALILTLPEINFQIATWPPITAEKIILANEKMNATWSPLLVNQVGTYFNLLVEMWLIMLVAIAGHASRKITWGRAVMYAVIAYFVYFTVRLFIGF